MAGSQRHAFLIMAHRMPAHLQMLLSALDDERHDIYVHIDKKAGPEMDAANFSTQKARLHFVKRMKVSWGGYSQIACSLRLLGAALADGEHAYYHFFSGDSYVLKTPDELHAYFDATAGLEHVSFDYEKTPELGTPESDYFLENMGRVRWYWPFSEAALRPYINDHKILRTIREFAIGLQRRLNVDRTKRFNMELRKGYSNWSITQDFAAWLYAQRKQIHKFARHSVAADEIVVQTFLANSPFKDNVFNGGTYISTWTLETNRYIRPNHCFVLEDLPYLLNSTSVFARKFDDTNDDCLALVDALNDYLNTEPALREIPRRAPKEKSSPQVSIIMPAYNAAHEIGRALDSIAQNSMQDYELLVIDDGSSDNTADVVRAHAARDERIRLLSKTQGGVSSARNLGLDQARGEWLAFIDADDEIPPNYLEQLYRACDEGGSDWVASSYVRRKVTENGYEDDVANPACSGQLTFAGDEAKRVAKDSVFLGPTQLNSIPMVCMSMYRRSIVEEHHLRFREDLSYGEDTVFNFEFSHYVEGFSYFPDLYYIYYVKEDSATESMDLIQNFLLYEKMLLAFEDVCKRYHEPIPQAAYSSTYLFSSTLIKKRVFSDSDENTRNQNFRELRKILRRNPFRRFLRLNNYICSSYVWTISWFLVRTGHLRLYFDLRNLVLRLKGTDPDEH